MHALNLPPFDIKTKRRGEKVQIFDFLRQRYIILTPEEWVRQHFTHYLVEQLSYPSALLANEVSIEVGGVVRRCDSVLYHQQGGKPRIICEYKAPTVELTSAVFTQIQSYNSVLRADYLFLSNGLRHICCLLDYENHQVHFLPKVPHYSELRPSTAKE